MFLHSKPISFINSFDNLNYQISLIFLLTLISNLISKSLAMKKLLSIIAFIVIATSCVTNHNYISKSVKSSDITDIKYFKPLSYIYFIEKGNKNNLNDSVSMIAQKLLDSVIRNNEVFRIDKKIIVTGLNNNIKVNNELGYLFQTIWDKNKINGIQIPYTIDSIMKSNKQRFAMACVTSGFSMEKRNYKNKMAKEIGLSMLSGGLYANLPISASFSLYTIIIDSEKDEVVYYSRTLPFERSPTDIKAIRIQYKNLFEGYFTSSKSTLTLSSP